MNIDTIIAKFCPGVKYKFVSEFIKSLYKSFSLYGLCGILYNKDDQLFSQGGAPFYDDLPVGVLYCRSRGAEFQRSCRAAVHHPAAITYQINALEKETGLHLFERTTRRTKLTAAGQSFYLDMVQMTSFGRQALKKAQDIQDADRSHLTVGLRQLFDYSTFSSILAEFQHQFPNACVDVVPQDNRRPLEQLRSGQLDIGFFYATEHSRDRDISFTPLFSLGYHALMNPNSPLADRRALHLADLKGQSVVSSGAFDSFLSACQGPSLEQLAQVGVDCSKITPSFEGALIMIQMGTAMSIVPCLSTAVIPGIVKVPLLDFPPVTVEIAAMRHAPRLEVQSFIEIAKQKYAHHPDPLRMEALI